LLCTRKNWVFLANNFSNLHPPRKIPGYALTFLYVIILSESKQENLPPPTCYKCKLEIYEDCQCKQINNSTNASVLAKMKSEWLLVFYNFFIDEAKFYLQCDNQWCMCIRFIMLSSLTDHWEYFYSKVRAEIGTTDPWNHKQARYQLSYAALLITVRIFIAVYLNRDRMVISGTYSFIPWVRRPGGQ
jgi:hypothetical protein